MYFRPGFRAVFQRGKTLCEHTLRVGVGVLTQNSNALTPILYMSAVTSEHVTYD